MNVAVSPNTVPVQLDQELNSSKSQTGLRKTMCFLKYKIGLTPFCISGTHIFLNIITVCIGNFLL